ncbi:DNA replication/repair protein RecF [Oxynema aestuarii]|jgi:DNA replication and repair protein RecF|uniref:DNA replication and repair protein RecF n=1 Tax=Oxynema aestuarii AP17 TaxID=2064643 RepID=A0A6H1U190_9CYAN|nr:DNA replication/repair protein RecF [Oxynema aestuarii]QIZ72601.1 DNA replication/repair protein RecF [Oxynema aestuarii AP17]RMH76000.1 MAG: DNA replication/repair protein RecF [Cyanobacteria bacterium J007]
MFLQSLLLRQFRNYRHVQVEFNAPKTILVGDNAQGKTNLLEAVALLSTLKSARARRDRDLILNDETIAQINTTLKRFDNPVDLAIALRSNGRRTVTVNNETCRRQVDFLGILNVVQFSSLDLDLVRGGPDGRRTWLDTLLIQLEPIYADLLAKYNKVLKQRNALLKEMRTRDGGNRPDPAQFDSELALWDAQLAAIGARVTLRRSRAIDRLAPVAETWHGAISGRTEALQMRYAPNVEAMSDPEVRDDLDRGKQAFLDKIQEKAIAEHYQGTTLVGPHRDEIEFNLNDLPVRQFGSQGQQRTLVLALKLAELKLIEEVVGEPPVLLLDDVLAELDPKRQNQLLDAIQNRFQTLITATHLDAFEQDWIRSSQILQVKAGEIWAEAIGSRKLF